LIPYLGDSTLFLDRSSMVFLLLDPSGAIVRTIATPSGSRGGLNGPVRLDGHGRLLSSAGGSRSLTAGNPVSVSFDYVLRYDLVTRVLDTAVVVREDTTVRSTATPGVPGATP